MRNLTDYKGRKKKEVSQKKAARNLKNGRTPEQIEMDMSFCKDYYLTGYTFASISKLLNDHNKQIGQDREVSPQLVRKDMLKLLDRWQKENLEGIKPYMQLEVAKLDKMERELWDAWERTKEGKTTTIQYYKNEIDKIKNCIIQKSKKEGEPLPPLKLIKESGAGDAIYMRVILDVQKRRAQLFGYDDPVNIQLWNEPQNKKEESVEASKDEPSINIEVENKESRYKIKDIPKDMLIELARKIVKND